VTYDLLEPTVRDRIRRLVNDASNDAAAEYFPDDTYDRVIGQHTNWKRAAAEMAVSVAGRIEEDPNSIESDGDSMTFSPWSRTKALYALRDQLLAEADAEDAATVVPSAVPFMPELTPIEWRG
jgi:hypothetical protein